MDVLRIMDRPDFPQATDDERITLIRIANTLGGGDAGKLGRLWNSFPEARFPGPGQQNVTDPTLDSSTPASPRTLERAARHLIASEVAR